MVRSGASAALAVPPAKSQAFSTETARRARGTRRRPAFPDCRRGTWPLCGPYCSSRRFPAIGTRCESLDECIKRRRAPKAAAPVLRIGRRGAPTPSLPHERRDNGNSELALRACLVYCLRSPSTAVAIRSASSYCLNSRCACCCSATSCSRVLLFSHSRSRRSSKSPEGISPSGIASLR